MGSAIIGDHVVKAVEYLQYLGYWIGTEGENKNDKHIRAQATQLRFKLKSVRLKLGEQLALVYILGILCCTWYTKFTWS